ncbi:MAG: hypothetical protein AMJ62_16045 [Myxococcales bacterium SG8_38]|nr:MAG: hypothetical protein AMJ62_16045 [Myxococcales bacterium SG8_38]
MPRPFVSAKEAAALLGKAVFVDARAEPGADRAYGAGHVHGAIRADLETDLSEPRDPSDGGRHPLPPVERWLDLIGRWGIAPSTPVVVYDASGGGMAAARAWWMLRAVGHEPVMVVDGGWDALRRAGVPIDQGEPRASDAGLGPYPTAVDRWPVVRADFVERVRTDPTWRVIDARAPERYRGETENLDPVAGHIPGACNLYWQSQLDDEGVLDSVATLKERYADLLEGVSPDRVACYCGSGVTACHLLLTMEACGLDGAKLYVGSWSEWCRQGRPGALG